MKKYLSGIASILLLIGASLMVVGCGEVADTDRPQLNILSPSDEAQLGITEFQNMKQQLSVSHNTSLNAQLQNVGRRLSKVIELPGAQWEFVVFDDPSPNAFALPGGKVGVHTGLFQITKNEAGLAAVVGHEIAHVVARHSGERMTRGVLTAGAVAVGAYILNKKVGVDPKVAAVGLGGAAALDYKKHSRKQELEADKLGALYMARASYNPEESVRLWQRFSAFRDHVGQSQGFSLLSTHPVDEVRISELQAFMPRAKQEYKPNLR